MKELKLANSLIESALNFYKTGEVPVPSIVIDKEEYKKYDINLLKSELNKQNFDIIDGTNAPEPFNQFPDSFRKRKWYVYQIN